MPRLLRDILCAVLSIICVVCVALALLLSKLIYELHAPGNSNSPVDWVFPGFALLAALFFGLLAHWIWPLSAQGGRRALARRAARK